MKIFTISSGNVTEGAQVDSFILKGANVAIPAIIIGEEGRGRKLGVLPVQLLPDSYKEWQEEGTISIHSAKVGETKAGSPKLIETSEITDTEKCICVFRTKFGFRGSNRHTGDRLGDEFLPFPGKVLCEGIVAQGEAGRMSSGSQLVTVMPVGIFFALVTARDCTVNQQSIITSSGTGRYYPLPGWKERRLKYSNDVYTC